MNINSGVDTLKGIGEKTKVILNKLGIYTVLDLLYFLPRYYYDFINPKRISHISDFERVCIYCSIESKPKISYINKSLNVIKFEISDGNSRGKISIFNQPYLFDKIIFGEKYYFCGVAKVDKFGFSMSNPSIEPKKPLSIFPIYKLTRGLNNKKLISIFLSLLKDIELSETLPEHIIKKYELCDINFALKNIHFPQNFQDLDLAKKRLMIEELLLLCVILNMKKPEKIKSFELKNEIDKFYSILPFEPTNAQKKVISEIQNDFSSGICSNRLLQGDVGSGKTLIAQYCLFCAAKDGLQGILMAPTEILANQHYESTQKLFGSENIKTALLTGSVSSSEKERILNEIKSGEIKILIGTHALLYNELEFNDLAVVITDEQHRFGVLQREALSKKGAPHKIVMSATPIPRTLAKIMYGGMDISVLDELPSGRKEIKTKVIRKNKRADMYKYILEQAKLGLQAYVVCPLIDNNEMNLRSAKEVFSELKKIFGDSVGLIHSKLNNEEKKNVFENFVSGNLSVLVSTTVIEVGVDVKNANIIVIEDAYRFGLSQLHQLRGRVGRGTTQGWCFLVSERDNERLTIMEQSADGFYIAQKDLELRGPGEFLGTKQNGVGDLYMRHLITNTQSLETAKNICAEISENPNELKVLQDYAMLRFENESS